MKRRRWWLIAFSLVLLAACVGVWKWSERPPYRFMEGATFERVWIRTGFGPDTAVRDYRLARPFDRIVTSARTEMEAAHWGATQYGKDIVFSPLTDVDGQLAESIYISRPSGAGEPVDITIATRATWADRVRIWFKKSVLRDDR